MSTPEFQPPSVTEKAEPDVESIQVTQDDPDAEFGGPEARKKMERKLLWKLDLRMFILVIIYILNYVKIFIHSRLILLTIYNHRLTATMQGKRNLLRCE